jgi:hypothetical protein
LLSITDGFQGWETNAFGVFCFFATVNLTFWLTTEEEGEEKKLVQHKSKTELGNKSGVCAHLGFPSGFRIQ